MRRVFLLAFVAVAMIVTTVPAKAQYYQIANQLTGLISPALQGGFNYKGYVEMSGTAGIGNNRANFLGVTTSQGFRYSSWFFMGVGIGVDVAMAQSDTRPAADAPQAPWGYYRSTKTKVMVPVFTDFRFNLGDERSVAGFIDLKVGAAWLMGSSYLRMNTAYMTSDAQFYLKPTVGVRIPVNSQNPRQAFSIGLSYQLLTASNNYYWRDGSVTLNNVGVTVGYEW